MPSLATVSEGRRVSSVSQQLAIHAANQTKKHGSSTGDAEDLRLLRKEMDSLRHRVVELEQGEEEHSRNYASARHMAALFEEYVNTATEEATAMLKSHETLKQQVESSEKLISLLAEKVITMVGTQANKVKELEEIQVGHQTKIADIDLKQKELTHKVNQLKHNEKQSQSHTPRRAPRTIGGGGGGGGAGGGHHGSFGGGGGGGATHFAADSHALDGEINVGRLDSIEQSMEASRQVILDQLRETKQQVDSVYGEIRRDHNQTNKQLEDLKGSIEEAREVLKLPKYVAAGAKSPGGKTATQKLRSSVHKINILNAFAKKRMKSEAVSVAASPKNVSSAVRSLSQVGDKFEKKSEEATRARVGSGVTGVAGVEEGKERERSRSPSPSKFGGKSDEVIPASDVSLIQDLVEEGKGEGRDRRTTRLAGSGDTMFSFG
ncbi:hypothetical protein TrLO_g11750 [Triparma laevis f. longispina]|uniref:Uncharacterized protein n=1 Tax=Triparma laevis f. longispina TaxID=1714387 RepID=A0A9W7C8D9_9STRA|nr:hypothetical protein TrLO_g11750 [Triparma laevis f. longispina]